MSENDKKPLIVIKKIKKSAHGHHGGAWKVAYADFVTAMMAFFLLLWLLSSQPEKKLTGIANYFTPTIGIRDMKGIGFEASNSAGEVNTNKNTKGNNAIIYGSNYKGNIVKVPETAEQNHEKIDAHNFSSVSKDLYRAIHENQDNQSMLNGVKIDETPEGLRIQLLDQDKRPMFIPNTYILQDYTKKILILIAKYIKFLPNYVAISGHTSKDLITMAGTMDNFELSAKRANATRQFLVNGWLDKDQIERIIGKADQEPLDPNHPNDISNIRISLTLLRNSLFPFQKQSAPIDFSINAENNTSK